MKILFLLINVLIFSNYLYASNLFETSFNNIEFNSINIQENSVHGSDSDENSKIEIKYFFNEEEIVG